jgi:hypothetical protein
LSIVGKMQKLETPEHQAATICRSLCRPVEQNLPLLKI